MSEFKSEKKDVESRLENLEKDAPASQIEEMADVSEVKPTTKKPTFLSSSYKTRAAVAKIAAIEPERPMPSVPAEVKEHIKELKQIGEAIIEQEQLEKETAEALDAESLFAAAASKKIDKKVFCDEADRSMNLSLDQLRDRLHELQALLIETNSRAQAVFGVRGQKLKDVSSEERARRMREDFEFKTPKKTKSESGSTATTKSERKPKESADQQMIRTLTARFVSKGMTQSEAEKKAIQRVKEM